MLLPGKFKLFTYLLLAYLLVHGATGYTDEAGLKVAVASNFVVPLEHLLADQHTSINLIPGSSGVLFAQILHGAPFDIFLSADTHRPETLEAQGFILPDSRHTYARGKLALWSLRPETDWRDLAELPGKLAIANPRFAPYGQAAMNVLKHSQQWQTVQDKLVMGANVAQTFAYVQSGNAIAGFLPLSLLLQAQVPTTQYQLLPTKAYQPIEQQLVILKSSAQQPKAQAFVSWLMSDDIQAKIAQMGYQAQGSHHD